MEIYTSILYNGHTIDIVHSSNGIRLFRDTTRVTGSDYVNTVFTKDNNYRFGDDQHYCEIDDMEVWFAHYMADNIIDWAYPNIYDLPPELDLAAQEDWIDHPDLVADLMKFINTHYICYGVTVGEHSTYSMHAGEGISDRDTGVAFIHRHDYMMIFGTYNMKQRVDELMCNTIRSYCDYCNGYTYHYAITPPGSEMCDYFSDDYSGYCESDDYTGIISDAKEYINNLINNQRVD